MPRFPARQHEGEGQSKLPGQRPPGNDDPLVQWRRRRRVETAQQDASAMHDQNYGFLDKTEQQVCPTFICKETITQLLRIFVLLKGLKTWISNKPAVELLVELEHNSRWGALRWGALHKMSSCTHYLWIVTHTFDFENKMVSYLEDQEISSWNFKPSCWEYSAQELQLCKCLFCFCPW